MPGAVRRPGAAAPACADLGLRAIVYLEVFGADESALDRFHRIRDEVAGAFTDRVRLGVSPHAPYTVSDDLYRMTTELALSEGLPMALHVAESRAERELVTEGGGDFAPGLRARGIDTPTRGTSPIEMLDRLGVLRARPLLIHCVDVGESDIARIADSGSAVAHCPIANAKLGHGVAPLPELLAAGVPVGLGVDGYLDAELPLAVTIAGLEVTGFATPTILIRAEELLTGSAPNITFNAPEVTVNVFLDDPDVQANILQLLADLRDNGLASVGFLDEDLPLIGKSLNDLIAAAREKPGQVVFGGLMLDNFNGASSGDWRQATIGRWAEDAAAMIDVHHPACEKKGVDERHHAPICGEDR